MTCRAILLALLPAALTLGQTPASQKAQGSPPECPHTATRYWSNCTGTDTSSTGEKYVGEFRDGKFNGKGIYTFASGNQYAGEFRDDRANGQGTFTYASGDKYVGELQEGKFNGSGTFTFSNGNKYVGQFRDGNANGRGALTYADGKQQVGEFKDGKFIDPLRRFEVVLRDQNGVLVVPVLINNKIPLDFILDSGASDVSVPADVVLTLMRTGTLTEADFTGTTTYVLADGSKVPSRTFRIRSLKVGEKTLENVSGSVASVNGSLLLGQSFLKRFKSWSIDNERQVLVLQ